MNEYTQTAEEMKEMLITEYLRKHPDLSRADITTKLVNGRIIVESIGNILKNCAVRAPKKTTFSPLDQKLLKQLSKGGDERYVECLDSIGSSKKYAGWLHKSKFTGFSDTDYDEVSEFLERRDELCGKRALEILNIKRQMLHLMQAKVKASQSLVQTLTMEYFQSVTGQLKTQGAIYNKEIDLGNLFTGHVESFVKQNIRIAQPKLNKQSLISIANAYQIASNQKITPLEIPKKIQSKEFSSVLDQVKENLNQLRSKFETMQKLIHFMETIVAELLKAKNEDLASEPPQDKTESSSTRRMAFTTRNGRR